MHDDSAKLLNKSHCEKLVRSVGFKSFSLNTSELEGTDLDLLDTDQQKRAFFVNLHNLLSLHAVVLYLAEAGRRQVSLCQIVW